MVELYYYCYINLHCGCIDRFISPFLSRIAKLKLTRMTTIIRSEEQKKSHRLANMQSNLQNKYFIGHRKENVGHKTRSLSLKKNQSYIFLRCREDQFSSIALWTGDWMKVNSNQFNKVFYSA